MKTIRYAGLMWVMLSLMVLVTSCGVSVSPEGLADEAIKEAERLAPEDNNLAFPEIGSLYLQEKEAYKCLDRLQREENSSLAKKYSNDEEGFLKAYRALTTNVQGAKDLIRTHFKDEQGSVSSRLAGKEIPVESDETDFSMARVRINDVKDAVLVDYEITPVGSISGSFKIMGIDKEGKTFYTMYPRERCAAGATVHGQTLVPLNVLGQCSKLKFILNKW